MNECQKTEYAAFVAVRLLDGPATPPHRELETARRHLQGCTTCRQTIPAEIRARFVSQGALERDQGARRSSR